MAAVIVRFDVVPGLARIVAAELGGAVRESADAYVIADVDLAAALGVRTAHAAYLTQSFAVARPKALLGDANLRAVFALVERVRTVSTFASVRIGAAGADSAVFQRLASELSNATGLPQDPDDGDLLVRVARAPDGWVVLVRLTPRPLSARAWRVPGFEGALDASVAAAMVRLTQPRPDDVFLDPLCGSGTIVIERAVTPSTVVLGSDVDPVALAAAAANGAADLARMDTGNLALAAGSVSALCANPPWGHQMGSHAENEALHPAMLREAARVARPGARFVVLTHELRRFEQALRAQQAWRTIESFQLSFKGHHPRIWVLARST